MRRRAIEIIALILLLGTALSGCGGKPPASSAKDAPPTDAPAASAGVRAPGEPATPLPVEADDGRTGSDQADVTLIAFLDYECRYCREAFDVLGRLRAKYPNESLRIAIKHLPLEGHPMALPAAIAAQAVMDEAGAEAFFEFSALAFENQADLSYAGLADWADQVGVTRSVYNEAVASEATLEKVATDARLAWRRGAEATPTVFVNGRLIDTVPGDGELALVIDEELAKMRAEPGDWAARYARRVTSNAEASLAQALLAEDPADYRVPVAGSATLGSPDAPVTVVVFTDYQCPYCKRADVTLEALAARYPKDVRLVFKHLPLAFHASARPAARLAEAVRQAKGDAAFFATSKRLFELSPQLGEDNLLLVGREQGLDTKVVKAAIAGEDAAIEDRIERDLELADDVEAAGTPHVFINGKRIPGARPLEHFEAVVLAEKRRAAARISTGVAPGNVYEALQEGALKPGAPAPIAAPPITADSPTRGPSAAPVAVHVFSDFECPYCRQAEQTLLELERRHPGTLRIVWHDRPLDFHPLARPAARAGREARRQGGDAAFWKLHALMFGLAGEKAAVGRADLLAHAKAVGLDVAAMEKAIDTPLHDAAIDRDIALATSLGFQGTPAFVVGNYALTGARGLRHFERLVALSLESPSAAPSAPNPPAPTGSAPNKK
jgi:protein-disulfide isomerase